MNCLHVHGMDLLFFGKLNLNRYMININDLTDNEKYIFTQGYEQGQKESLENYDNIEKIIDAYLVVKHECQNKDFMERHDFISLVIEKTKQI